MPKFIKQIQGSFLKSNFTLRNVKLLFSFVHTQTMECDVLSHLVTRVHLHMVILFKIIKIYLDTRTCTASTGEI